jgi:proline-specific peptidase
MKHTVAVLAAVLLIVGTWSAVGAEGAQGGITVKEGYINTTAGKVWYKKAGDGDATPLLILHGGPGIPSCYLNPLAVLASARPVIFYDQLGCGNSPAPDDTSHWTIDFFVNELAEVRKALGLDEVHLYGHSWGSTLAVAYMLTKPEGVKSLILAGPALDFHRWADDSRKLLATLDDSLQQIIEFHEQNGTTDAPEYQEAMSVFYQHFVARKTPWSDDINKAFATMNPHLYEYMFGPSEFTITGTLKDYNITGRLGEITVPTLFSAGEFDEAPPATTKYYASLVPGAKVVIVKGAGHLTFQDDIEADSTNINAFLHDVESK